MKWILIITFLLFSFPLYAQNWRSPPSNPPPSSDQMDKIEIIEGAPAKPFKRLRPLMEQTYTFEGALKKMKLKAAKVGADAIIEFKAESKSASIFGGGVGSYGGTFSGGQYSLFEVKGWAVKWE